MAKKINAKEKRELLDQTKKARLAQMEIERKEKDALKIKKNEECINNNLTDNKSGRLGPKSKKTLAKANGLRSSFLVGQDIYLTAYGKGSDAVIEKKVVKKEGTSIDGEKIVNTVNITEPNYEASINKDACKKVNISSNRIGKDKKKIPVGVSDLPNINSPRRDILNLKDILEKKYFGKTYDDNIHIQIIYNIFDLRKILTVHSNNIVVALDNLLRFDSIENIDLIGDLSPLNDYESFEKNTTKFKLFEKMIKSPRINYFGNAINPKKPEDAYKTFALLGGLRQDCSHNQVKIRKENGETENFGEWLFNLDNPQILNSQYQKFLTETYEKTFSLENIKKNFLETSGVNITIVYESLKRLFGNVNKESLIQDYFSFIELKEYKNLGFSLKTIREKLLEFNESSFIKCEDYDSVRSKLYRALDFVIYYYYLKNADYADDIVLDLRQTLTAYEKNEIYNREAKNIQNFLGKELRNLADNTGRLSINKEINKNIYNEYSSISLPDFSQASMFSKLIYLVTMFLDGKEINDLLTTLINKFEAIHSLNNVVKTIELELTYTDNYKMFENSGSIAKELRIINNIARMKPIDKTPSARKAMYHDALDILGMEGISDTEIDGVLNDILGVNSDGEKIKQKGEYGFRNFIASNVIESTWFKYIIRYANPKKVRNLAKNPKIVSFAISNMFDAQVKDPETAKKKQDQIERYYKACNNGIVASYSDEKEYLTKLIVNLNFNDINKQIGKPKQVSEPIKVKYQTILSFYLMVLYQIIKNLVYVNSRYLMAFYAGGRDAALFGSDAFEETDSTDYWGLTNIFIDGEYKNEYAKKYLKTNIANISDKSKSSESKTFVSGNMIIKHYRNCIAHLSVVRNADIFAGEIKEVHSYFELYHFIMQKLIEWKVYENGKTFDDSRYAPSRTVKGYFDKTNKHGVYTKDFVKALNSPFGYNLPRFKNLSIDDLFDKNNTNLPKGTKEYKTEI